MTKLKMYWTQDSNKPKYLCPLGKNALIVDANGCLYNGTGYMYSDDNIDYGRPQKIGAGNDAFLDWGTTNIVGTISPVDMAMSNLHSANRLAFANPAGITIEYSKDGGQTWILPGEEGTMQITDSQKINLISGLYSPIPLGGNENGTSDWQTRITLNADELGVYTLPKKMLINFSTGYATNCKVDVSIKKYNDDAQADIYDIIGWSGWNSISLAKYATKFGSNGYTPNHISTITLTFSQTVRDDNIGKETAKIFDIALFGETAWTTPSTMAKSGHLYTYDASQNGYFPANVTASAFYESSDEKLKNFKSDINIDLNKLSQIPKKYFTWKDDKNETLHIGTSAQEIQKLYPEIVSSNDDGLTVDYAKLSIIALAAIDKLHQEINELKQQLNKKEED